MFTKESCITTLTQYDHLKDELERILKIIDSYSHNITSIEFSDDSFHVSYEDCCMSCWGTNDATIPFDLLEKSNVDIQEFINEKRKREKLEKDEQYKKEIREQELRKLKELSQKYPDAM